MSELPPSAALPMGSARQQYCPASRSSGPKRPQAYLNGMSRTVREHGLETHAHPRSQQKAGEICGLEVRPKSGVEAKIVSRRERKEPNAKSYPLIRRAFGDAAIVDGWRFAADVHFSAGPLAAKQQPSPRNTELQTASALCKYGW